MFDQIAAQISGVIDQFVRFGPTKPNGCYKWLLWPRDFDTVEVLTERLSDTWGYVGVRLHPVGSPGYVWVQLFDDISLEVPA